MVVAQGGQHQKERRRDRVKRTWRQWERGGRTEDAQDQQRWTGLIQTGDPSNGN